MKRFIQRFRQLRWKLTLSYTLTSVVAFQLLVVLAFGGLLLWLGTNISTIVLNTLKQQAPQGAPYLARASTDPEPLITWLQITAVNDANQNPNQDPFHYHPIFLAMTDTQGHVIASAGSQPLEPGTQIQTELTPQNGTQLTAVLNDTKGTTGAAGQDSDNTLVAIAPVMGGNGSIQGALVMKIVQPDARVMFLWLFSVLLFGSIVATILAAISGTIFGYIIARGITRRLKRLSTVADRWGGGDFSVRAVDRSQDEMGQITHQLNRMAEQLQNLLQTRRKLATLEERNRLARDLHDSVKQQIFVVSMQIGAIKLLLRRDVDAAEARLQKTEKLVQQAQQELTSLIRELRPAALEGKSLVAALRELIPQWSQQTEIVANLRVEGSQTLPITVEEALFRVAQEALSNVARHSRATLVQITLTLTEAEVTLSILDNGQGFDPAQLEERGVGLLSMQERMKALGGDVQLESAPGKGTCIIASCNRLGVDTSETAKPDAGEESSEAPSQKVTPQR